jgi:uncharacterized protein (TIGR02271 family)
MEADSKIELGGSDGTVTEAVPEVEEHASVSKRLASSGKVRVRTLVENYQHTVQATLESDSVQIERVPVGKEIDRAPDVRTEGAVTIVPVVEEVLVVTRQLFLKEELHVRRRTEVEKVELPVTLRRQSAVVERLDQAGNPLPTEE